MNSNDTNTDLLIQYLDNELNDATKATVEQKLASDAAFRDQLSQLQLAREAVRLYGLKQHVIQIGSEFKPTQLKPIALQKGRVRSMTKWSLRVAAILILMIAGIGVYEYTTISNNNLYAQLYQPYERRGSRGNEQLDAVQSAYNKKDYASSITSFESQAEHSTADYFYVGQAYMAMNNLDKATTNLEKALHSSQDSHQYVQESEFYLALVYLKTNDLEKAEPLFKKIHDDPNHLFHDKVSSWFMKKLSFLEKKTRS